MVQVGFLPKTRLGTWTVRLNIFCLFIAAFLFIFAGLLKLITSEAIIAIFGATSVIISIAAFFTGMIDAIKNKDWSILVFLAILIGFAALVFILGDIFGDILGLDLPDINLPGF